MYRSYFKLQKKPFQISTDPDFLWLGKKHKRALATLEYGILDNKGFVLLTGDVGTGKTTLINALINRLGEKVIVAMVPDPGMDYFDFVNYISHAFNMKKEFFRKKSFLIHFSQFLNTAHTVNRKKVLLIIDESQRLSSELLEEIRLLSNIEKQDSKLLNIFFIGQNEFNNVLLQSQNNALLQRIAINSTIGPLDLEETGNMIRYRLKVAGASREIFDASAIQAVHSFSNGYPRRINIICDYAMLTGLARDKHTITAELVRDCSSALSIPQTIEGVKQPQPLAAVADNGKGDSPTKKGMQQKNLTKPAGIPRWFAPAVVAVMAVACVLYLGHKSDSLTGENVTQGHIDESTAVKTSSAKKLDQTQQRENVETTDDGEHQRKETSVIANTPNTEKEETTKNLIPLLPSSEIGKTTVLEQAGAEAGSEGTINGNQPGDVGTGETVELMLSTATVPSEVFSNPAMVSGSPADLDQVTDENVEQEHDDAAGKMFISDTIETQGNEGNSTSSSQVALKGPVESTGNDVATEKQPQIELTVPDRKNERIVTGVLQGIAEISGADIQSARQTSSAKSQLNSSALKAGSADKGGVTEDGQLRTGSGRNEAVSVHDEESVTGNQAHPPSAVAEVSNTLPVSDFNAQGTASEDPDEKNTIQAEGHQGGSGDADNTRSDIDAGKVIEWVLQQQRTE